MIKRKWLDRIIELKIRIDAGNALIYWTKNLIIIVAGIKYILSLSIGESIALGILGIVALYFLGWLDLDIVKFSQRANEISTEKYNYYFKKLKSSVHRTSR